MTLMIAAVRKAARGVQRDYGEVSSLQISVKGPGDFVTNSDKRAEKTLREELLKARPAYGILGEEDAEVKGTDPDHKFIIDPIDGTFNFMHALPFFAITIALERKGEVVAGVTYNPITDELFHAEKGTGAFVNNKRMRVASRRELSDSLLASGLPNRGDKDHAERRAEMAMMQAKTAGIRCLGSTALDMAYVAMGRLDGAWHDGLKPWDMAAGILMIREAGGFVHGLKGEANPLYTGGYVATNADLLPQMKNVLADAKKLKV
ncbi:MAG: inositol monophosphatase [Alphaproteobacteria bacterium]|nr:inositol monophosphatase [Alphaproteobacteria bacterium]